ncbi:hypothetical protein NDU88_006164 [Pleurodeles waltl]|uniref:Uncharacterized protein n=1 Tax=Pleurodeles waltl TaxID=8319 RepID=A0AAV7ULL9_PLEWA|nr:hypothetical protein NDU88_006164 [Pleurodeles waltl]
MPCSSAVFQRHGGLCVYHESRQRRGAGAQPATKHRRPEGLCAAAVHTSARHAEARFRPSSASFFQPRGAASDRSIPARAPGCRPHQRRVLVPCGLQHLSAERQRARGGAGPQPQGSHSPAGCRCEHRPVRPPTSSRRRRQSRSGSLLRIMVLGSWAKGACREDGVAHR